MTTSGTGQAWSRAECEATVRDYFDMLSKQAAGVPYNKTAHRRSLSRVLDGRSEGAIERKHQNISAILLQSDCPYIDGYKPLPNVQSLLRDVVLEYVATEFVHGSLRNIAVPEAITNPTPEQWQRFLTEAPERSVAAGFVADTDVAYGVAEAANPIKIDYLAREASQRALGEAGEKWVVAFERARLVAEGAGRLVDRVEHVAETRGDGLGYDVLSFEADGRERLIEVKTTVSGRRSCNFSSVNSLGHPCV